MRDFIEISADDVILEGKAGRYGGIPYIVYHSPGHPHQKIRINTDYTRKGGKLRISTHYDRGLCNTLEEHNARSMEYIEGQAYGAWMDGAR